MNHACGTKPAFNSLLRPNLKLRFLPKPYHTTPCPTLSFTQLPPFKGSYPDFLHRSHAKLHREVDCPILASHSHAELCREVIRDVLAPLLLQHHPQAAAEGSGQRRRDGIADLPVAVVHVAGELEVVREALQIEEQG